MLLSLYIMLRTSNSLVTASQLPVIVGQQKSDSWSHEKRPRMPDQAAVVRIPADPFTATGEPPCRTLFSRLARPNSCRISSRI